MMARVPIFPRRLTVAVVSIVGGAAFLSGCSGSGSHAPSATVHTVEYRFEPPTLTVHKNAKVLVVNDGRVVHSWVLPQAGVGSAAIAPGASQTVDLSGVAPGTYSVICDQPGHARLGQIGSVTITP
jgi:plastocyanin